MPITPKFAAQLTREETTAVRSYEAHIDSELKVLFLGGSRGFSIELPEPPTPRVAAYIRSRYIKAGWQVSEGNQFLGEGNFTFYFQAKDPVVLHEHHGEFPELIEVGPRARIHTIDIEGDTNEPEGSGHSTGKERIHTEND